MKEIDQFLSEAEQRIPKAERVVRPAHHVFGEKTGFIKVGLTPLMAEAADVLRHRHANNRAEAVEMSFDWLLAKGTKCRWERTGEVRIDREKGVAEALCTDTKKEVK